MTKITRGNPPNLANVRSNIYHHYIRIDNPKSLIFLSGQLSRDANGKLVGPGDMAEQTRQAIRNMETVMEAAGGTLEDIVSIVVYTTDIRQFKEIVAARMEFFKDKLPTSTIVEVNHLADPGTADRVPGDGGAVGVAEGASPFRAGVINRGGWHENGNRQYRDASFPATGATPLRAGRCHPDERRPPGEGRLGRRRPTSRTAIS